MPWCLLLLLILKPAQREQLLCLIPLLYKMQNEVCDILIQYDTLHEQDGINPLKLFFFSFLFFFLNQHTHIKLSSLIFITYDPWFSDVIVLCDIKTLLQKMHCVLLCSVLQKTSKSLKGPILGFFFCFVCSSLNGGWTMEWKENIALSNQCY